MDDAFLRKWAVRLFAIVLAAYIVGMVILGIYASNMPEVLSAYALIGIVGIGYCAYLVLEKMKQSHKDEDDKEDF